MSLQTPVERTREKPPEPILKKRTARRDLLLAFLAACGMLGPALYIVTWVVAGLLYPGYNQLTQATSELTSTGAPPTAAAVANFGGVALGLLLVAFAFGLYRGVRRSAWLLLGTILVGLFGLVCIGQTFFPMNPGGPSWLNAMHGIMFVISGVALIPGLLALSVAFARDPSFRAYRWYTFSTPFLMLLAGQANVLEIFPAGVPERLANLVVLVWIEVVATRLLWLALYCEPGKIDRLKS